MAITGSPDHHGSHRHLLKALDAPATRARVDAIIVPTVRPTAYLGHTVELSRKLDCPLVVLGSGPHYTGFDGIRAVHDPAARLHAFVVADPARLRLPALATSRVLPAELRRGTDTAAKRNLGLAITRMLGWERVIFMDDDIEVPSPDDLRRAATLLDQHAAVALSVDDTGFPDNSVVCHAYREVGGDQESFVGGGALAVETTRHVSFFPDVYNEDWFYLLDDDGLRSLAVAGTIRQRPYDPFADPGRARTEELGDVLAEGLFWLLDEGRGLADADHAHWAEFLARRERFVAGIADLVPTRAPAGRRAAMLASLTAALDRLRLITPELCLAYLAAWREDRRVWRDYLDGLEAVASAPDLRLTREGAAPLDSLHLG
ncbi:hypothetical protein [Nonomuraea longicatena]|uniref:Glycosyltransferase n=1 Tax=Nonomuraea longicatena TaxID=83682 RepID=A0ABN1QNQ9_9ACTN